MRNGRVSSSELLSIAGLVVALIMALIGVIWRMLNKRLDGLENTMNINIANLYESAKEDRKETAKIFERGSEETYKFQREMLEKMNAVHTEISVLTAKTERD